MGYTKHRSMTGAFDEVLDKLKDALKAEGFGVLTDIDISATLKAKTGANIAAYRILGACHPPSAQRAIEAEPRIGVMLPCNVIVRDVGNNEVEVAAIDPTASMTAVGNPEINAVAEDISARLSRVLNAI